MPAYIIFYFIGLMTAGVANAVPVEGFDSLYLLGRGNPGVTVNVASDQIQSAWLAETYQLTRIQTTIPMYDLPFSFDVGLQTQTIPNAGDRGAAYLRTDWRFAETNALSLKYTYSTWNYLSSSRDFLTFEYSSFFPYSTMSGVYLSIGYFHRWLRQSWDKSWAQPMNWDTEDHMGFISLLVGWQWEFGEHHYWTIDLNNREPFDHHNLDHAAIDLTVNINLISVLYLNFIGGMRTSSSFMGTIYPAQYMLGIGLTYY